MSAPFGDRLHAAFSAALDIRPDERVAWARASHADDPELLDALLELLESQRQADGFLEPGPDAFPADASTIGESGPALPPLEGRVVADRYEVVRRLGSGGAGVVYAARDGVTGARVAVKALSAEVGSADSRREAATLRLLRVPGVVHLLDDGLGDGFAYIVTELVDGEPFPACSVPCRWSDIERAVVALLETVGRIHWAGVVHRDLKPGNVLVTAGGLPVVLDLGVSESSRPEERSRTTNRYAGTLRYMAPEQIQKGAWSPGSDLYAVAAMTYEALSGAPFRSDASAVFAGAGVAPDDTRPLAEVAPGVPPDVAAVIDQMLARDPGARPASAEDVLLALPGLAAPPGAPELLPADGPDALASLFHGPERVFHLPSDAARELWRRTGGDPGAMRDELGAWERAGLGRWESGRFLIARPALKRLRGGLQLRAAMPPLDDSEAGADRLLQALASDDRRRIADEARALAESALDAGDPAAADGAIGEGLRAVRRSRDSKRETALLGLLLRSALLAGTRGAIDQLLYAQSRARPSPLIDVMQRVARGALRVLDGECDVALAQVPDPRGIADPVVRRAAVAVRLFAARVLDADAHRRLIDDIALLADELDCPSIAFAALGASGWLAYARHDYDEAGGRHVAAAERATTRAGRMSSTLNAASAYLESGQFDRAEALAREARAYFSELRHAHPEARAEWVVRAAAYRRGDALEPDLEFAAASLHLGDPNLVALVCLNEAAVAWRAGCDADAIELASGAATTWREIRAQGPALLANALAYAAGSDEHHADDLLSACEACDMPGIVLQAAALVAARSPDRADRARALVERALPALGRESGGHLEILSVDAARRVGAR